MLGLATVSVVLAALPVLSKPLSRRSEIEACLEEASVPIDTKGSEDWDWDAAPFNVRTPYEPVAIAVPRTTEHIQDAIKCGVEAGVKVTAKCGGHSYGNFGFGGEDGHLMLELDRMNEVKLDLETGIATIQGGSRLGHVAYELYNQGKRAFSHGTCPGVGVGGHTLHGGYGMSSHTKGLALDWLVGATIVLANSTVVKASEEVNPDIFWAIRGAGSSMGVISEFVFKTFQTPDEVTHFLAVVPWAKQEAAVAGIKRVQEYTETEMPAELNARLFLTPQFANLEGMYYGNKEDLLSLLDPLLQEIGGHMQVIESTDWPGQLSHFGNGLDLDQSHPYRKQENIYSSSLYTDKLNDEQLDGLVSYWFDVGKKVRRQWYLQIDLHGGQTSAVSAPAIDVSSYAYRKKLLLYQFYDRVDVDKVYPDDGMSFFDGFVANITATMDREEYGMYFNYPDPEMEQDRAQDMYWGDALARLQAIKADLDPNEVFYMTQSVRPTKHTEQAGKGNEKEPKGGKEEEKKPKEKKPKEKKPKGDDGE